MTKRLRKGVSLKAMIILLLIHLQLVEFLDRDEAVAGKWSFVERLHGRLLKYWSSVIGDILSNPAHCAQCTVQWREREKCKLVSLVCSSTVQRSQLKWMTASTERHCHWPTLTCRFQSNAFQFDHILSEISRTLAACLLRWKMTQV